MTSLLRVHVGVHKITDHAYPHIMTDISIGSTSSHIEIVMIVTEFETKKWMLTRFSWKVVDFFGVGRRIHGDLAFL
jgi:hypothetical protein